MMTYRNWIYEAVQLIKDFVEARSVKFFIADDVIAFAWRTEFQEPGDLRWWGQALQQAADLGLIRASALPGRNDRRRHKTTLWFVNP